LFGCTSQIISETIFDGAMGGLDDLWGGLPFLIIAGNVYQLASMYQGAIECLIQFDGNKRQRKGVNVFVNVQKKYSNYFDLVAFQMTMS
jgi:hypothetical protein